MSETVVVIVGASRGIGLETARLFAQNDNTRVLCFSRSFSVNHPLRDFNNVALYPLDLARADIHEQLASVIASLEKVDILINNAGHIVVKPFAELSHSEISTAYQVNVIGVMQTIQAFLPKLASGSHIVNISSMGGFQGSAKFAGLSAYSTSKAAVVSLTELLAEELKETGIKINCLCLGAVQTEMLEAAFPGYQAPVSASEMAAFIRNFAETASGFMHGRIIPVSLSTP